jgi:uncharacterized protein YdaL
MKNILHKLKVPSYLFTGIVLAVYLVIQGIMFLPASETNKELLDNTVAWPEFKNKIIEDLESYGYYSMRESKELEDMIEKSNNQYYLQKMKEQ